MRTIALLLLALSIPVFGQTAKVIALSPEDAAIAKSLAEQHAAIDKKVEDFQASITKKYLSSPKEQGQGCFFNGLTYIKFGWGCGEFDYSEDYKFIVPRITPVPIPSKSWVTYANVAGHS